MGEGSLTSSEKDQRMMEPNRLENVLEGKYCSLSSCWFYDERVRSTSGVNYSSWEPDLVCFLPSGTGLAALVASRSSTTTDHVPCWSRTARGNKTQPIPVVHKFPVIQTKYSGCTRHHFTTYICPSGDCKIKYPASPDSSRCALSSENTIRSHYGVYFLHYSHLLIYTDKYDTV